MTGLAGVCEEVVALGLGADDARTRLASVTHLPIEARLAPTDDGSRPGRVLAVLAHDGRGGDARRLAGRHPALDLPDLPPGAAVDSIELVVSARGWARYLPDAFTAAASDGGQPFVERLLLLIEERWATVEAATERLHDLLDPAASRAEGLDWLAGILGVPRDLDEARKRDLLPRAVGLARRRGTREAIEEQVRLATGVPVRVIEHCGPPGFPLGGPGRPGAALGGAGGAAWLGGPGPGRCPGWLTVVLPDEEGLREAFGDPAERAAEVARRAVLREAPAHLHVHLTRSAPADGGPP